MRVKDNSRVLRSGRQVLEVKVFREDEDSVTLKYCNSMTAMDRGKVGQFKVHSLNAGTSYFSNLDDAVELVEERCGVDVSDKVSDWRSKIE